MQDVEQDVETITGLAIHVTTTPEPTLANETPPTPTNDAAVTAADIL